MLAWMSYLCLFCTKFIKLFVPFTLIHFTLDFEYLLNVNKMLT